MNNNWIETKDIVLRKKPQRPGDARDPKAVGEALRSGRGVDTTKKANAGGNKQHSSSIHPIDIENADTLTVKRVNGNVAKVISQARAAKGLSQKDLATQINEKPVIISEYESGKAIPDQQVLSKMERVLGVKLRGKDIGLPISK